MQLIAYVIKFVVGVICFFFFILGVIFFIILDLYVSNYILFYDVLHFSPGLSAKNLIATQPPEGTPTVFLSTGSTRLKFSGSLF